MQTGTESLMALNLRLDVLLADGDYLQVVALAPSGLSRAAADGHIDAEFGIRLALVYALILSSTEDGNRAGARSQVDALLEMIASDRDRNDPFGDLVWAYREVACAFLSELLDALERSDDGVAEHVATSASEVRRIGNYPAMRFLRLLRYCIPLTRFTRRVVDPVRMPGLAFWLALAVAYAGLVPLVAILRYGSFDAWWSAWQTLAYGRWLLYAYLVAAGVVLAWPLLSRPVLPLFIRPELDQIEEAIIRVAGLPETLSAQIEWLGARLGVHDAEGSPKL